MLSIRTSEYPGANCRFSPSFHADITTCVFSLTEIFTVTGHGSGSRKMFNDQDLGFFTNFLGIFIFVLAMAYHFVMADPKYEGN
ncbi:uncharacterized protein [Lolium perenne]|uniref:uncharacterized protein isoform X1 n=1 Tax=Lolium perenne TaxID=4522 RepID=UPI0021F5BF3D|nr:uncharacterized protein LOC127332370 isoform X2 [Lolium perenne]